MSTIYWAVYDGNTDPTTAQQIIDGAWPDSGNVFTGSDVSPTEDTVGFLGTVITELTPDTSYKLAGVWSDAAGNDSNIQITAPFVTEPAPVSGGIKLGAVDIQKLYLGIQELPQAYLGDIPLLGAGAPPFIVSDSCMFSAGSNSRLNYSPAGASPFPDYQSFTFSTWFKRNRVGQPQVLYAGRQADTNYSVIRINGNDELEWYDRDFDNGSDNFFGEMPTDVVFRDPSAWYHLVFQYDSSNPDAAERVRMWVNGVRMSLRILTVVQLNRQPWMNSTHTHHIGWTNDSGYSDILMADTIMVDGTHVAPTAFGKFDNNGVWQPIDYAATAPYGTNGYRLGYANPTNLGEDSSGNGNDFALENVSESNAFADTPSENFCTLLATDTRTTGTITEGGLVTTGNAAVSMRPESGEWYYEQNGVGVVYDADASGEFDPVLPAGSYNFGQQPWQDTGPVGAQRALSSSNLPNPVIAKPSEHVTTVLYTGDGAASRDISVPFQPDWVWAKNRTQVKDHQLLDAVRSTAGGILLSNDTNAEALATSYSGGGLTQLLADGFRVEQGIVDSSNLNESGEEFVAWNWKQGTLPGFEIVGYTGDGVAGRTVAHNLGAKPAAMIIKSRDNATDGWFNYFDTPTMGATGALFLDKNNGFTTSINYWNNEEPTDAEFTVGAATTNRNNDNFIAYLFAEVPGFSKVTEYIGNGNADGPIVYCGFRPAVVIIKTIGTSPLRSWRIFDSARPPYNPAIALFPNSNDVERDDQPIDFLANGFKLRTTQSGLNDNGQGHVVLAFAEHPFKTARAR